MELKQALEGDDIGEIRAKTDALQEASHKLAEAVYASAQQQQASTSSEGNGASTSDDEVVEEGDYEVIDEEQEAPKA
jgi:molecular chaperone DnaK